MGNLIDKIKVKSVSELPELFRDKDNDVYIEIEDDTNVRLDVLTWTYLLKLIKLLDDKGILDDKDI